MKPKLIPLIEMCVESGIKFGINRAYKYETLPSLQVIEEHVHREIMNQFYEWFDFERDME